VSAGSQHTNDTEAVDLSKLCGNMIGRDGIKAIIDASGERAQAIQQSAQQPEASPEIKAECVSY